MIKKLLMYIVLGLLLIYLLLTLIAPSIVDKSKNKTLISKPYQASEKSKQLLSELDFVADLHCDALLWNRNLCKKSDYGHVDFPRMQEGNIALQGFTLVTKSPKGQNFTQNSSETFDMITALCIAQGQAPSTWFSLVNRATYQCKKLEKFAKKYDDKFIVVKGKNDFQRLLEQRNKNKEIIGGFLGIEGAHCLEGNIENFQKVYDAGVRMLGPAHFFDNEMGGSAHGITQEGLSEFGFEVMSKMQEKGMIMDLAHSSVKVINDVLKNYDGPILTSHTGVQGIHNSPRNLSDKHLLGIAAKGGLVGIGYFAGALGDTKIESIVKTMIYTRDLIGIEHIALGSDFDGSVTTPFDCSGLALLIDEMLKQGMTKSEISSIFGENVKRFMLQNLK